MNLAGDIPISYHLTHAIKGAAEGERTIMVIDGMKFAIVPVEDVELLEALEDAEDIRDAEEVLKRINEPGATVPFEEVMKEFGLSE
jgi:hypothetical protein